ncbi:peptidase [Burkholderia multivorans]|nr:peptidase [Burkholderia multivorans]KWF62017.1 peptidase [Burkholderia multivorans]
MTYHINPATGLPMTGDDYSGIDVGGNPYGTRLDSRQPWSAPFWDVM